MIGDMVEGDLKKTGYKIGGPQLITGMSGGKSW